MPLLASSRVPVSLALRVSISLSLSVRSVYAWAFLSCMGVYTVFTMKFVV